MASIAHTIADTTVSPSSLPNVNGNQNEITTALNIIFTLAGAIALLVIVLAGFRYIISRGDPQSTAQAKNAILYAVIGLVFCMTAFAIVNFVIGRTT